MDIITPEAQEPQKEAPKSGPSAAPGAELAQEKVSAADQDSDALAGDVEDGDELLADATLTAGEESDTPPPPIDTSQTNAIAANIRQSLENHVEDNTAALGGMVTGNPDAPKFKGYVKIDGLKSDSTDTDTASAEMPVDSTSTSSSTSTEAPAAEPEASGREAPQTQTLGGNTEDEAREQPAKSLRESDQESADAQQEGGETTEETAELPDDVQGAVDALAQLVKNPKKNPEANTKALNDAVAGLGRALSKVPKENRQSVLDAAEQALKQATGLNLEMQMTVDDKEKVTVRIREVREYPDTPEGKLDEAIDQMNNGLTSGEKIGGALKALGALIAMWMKFVKGIEGGEKAEGGGEKPKEGGEAPTESADAGPQGPESKSQRQDRLREEFGEYNGALDEFIDAKSEDSYLDETRAKIGEEMQDVTEDRTKAVDLRDDIDVEVQNIDRELSNENLTEEDKRTLQRNKEAAELKLKHAKEDIARLDQKHDQLKERHDNLPKSMKEDAEELKRMKEDMETVTKRTKELQGKIKQAITPNTPLGRLINELHIEPDERKLSVKVKILDYTTHRDALPNTVGHDLIERMGDMVGEDGKVPLEKAEPLLRLLGEMNEKIQESESEADTTAASQKNE